MIDGGDIVDFFFRGAFRILLEFLLYWTGRLVVPVVTFGVYRVEPLDFDGKGRRGRSRAWQTRTLSADTGTLIGLLCWAAAGVIAWRMLPP